MRLIIALFITALVWMSAPAKQINNSTTQDKTKVQAVQAEVARESPTNHIPDAGKLVQEKALMDQPVVVEPEQAAKVETPAPQVTQATGCEKYRDIIDNYSWNVDVAIAVCNAESSGNPNNQNFDDYHKFADCWGSFGLFQINCSHGQVYDAAENIRIAATKYDYAKGVAWTGYNGWQPWSATTCKYKVKCY